MKTLSTIFISGTLVSSVLFMGKFQNDTFFEVESDNNIYQELAYENFDDQNDLVNLEGVFPVVNNDVLDPNEIEYIEDEEVIELGFGTKDYLPEGFDPYEGMNGTDEFGPLQLEITNLNDIEWIEDEEVIELGFDAKDFLPEGFDPYEGMNGMDEFGPLQLEITDLNDIEYIEDEEVIELGFDTKDYLPEGFDPYQGVGNLK